MLPIQICVNAAVIFHLLERVQSAPVLIQGYPKPRTVRVGDSVTLECLEKPNGPVSDYRWLKWKSLPATKPDLDFKNGNFIVLASSKYESFASDVDDRKLHGVKLHLENVSEDDRGFYTCFVSNNLGFSHGTAFLDVKPVSPTGTMRIIAIV